MARCEDPGGMGEKGKSSRIRLSRITTTCDKALDELGPMCYAKIMDGKARVYRNAQELISATSTIEEAAQVRRLARGIASSWPAASPCHSETVQPALRGSTARAWARRAEKDQCREAYWRRKAR